MLVCRIKIWNYSGFKVLYLKFEDILLVSPDNLHNNRKDFKLLSLISLFLIFYIHQDYRFIVSVGQKREYMINEQLT